MAKRLSLGRQTVISYLVLYNPNKSTVGGAIAFDHGFEHVMSGRKFQTRDKTSLFLHFYPDTST